MADKLWYVQDDILLLFFNHVNLYFLSISLVKNVYLYCMFYQPLLLKCTINIFNIYKSFNLNLYFLANFELMIKFMTLLLKNISTVALFYVLIFSSLIFTITFLRYFLDSSESNKFAYIILLVKTLNPLYWELSQGPNPLSLLNIHFLLLWFSYSL